MTVITHRRPSDTVEALRELIDAAVQAGVTLRLDEEETRKHPSLQPGPGVELNAPVLDDVELCVVLGGDGTILRALRLYAGTSVPVFAVNFGEIGFLATVEPGELGEGIARALDRRVRAAAAARDRARRPDGGGARPNAAPARASTTSRSTAASASASPRSRTRWRTRSSAAYAATAS